MSQYQLLYIINSLESLVRNYPRIAQNLLYKIYQNLGKYCDARVAAVF